MRKILIVGIGAGNPDHITIGAIKALNRADVLFFSDKGEDKAGLAGLRRAIIDTHVVGTRREVTFAPPPRDRRPADYGTEVEAWHAALAEAHARMFGTHLGEDETGAILVWGDPGLYDSTIRILDRVLAAGALDFTYEVVPGITSIQALTAAHGVPLNRIGAPVTVTTGRRLAELGLAGDAIVMLDGEQAFAALPDETEIFWGAYLGTPDEILIAGRLGAVRAKILAMRAQARARHGWIMDIYLLRSAAP